MTTPKYVHDAIALLQRERQTAQGQLDAIELCLANLTRIWSLDAPEVTEARVQPERRTYTRRKPKAVTHAPEPEAGAASETAARDEALLVALRRNGGVGTAKELRKAIASKGLTEEQVGKAVANSMYRLKQRGLVDRTGHTWSLSGAGSETVQ